MNISRTTPLSYQIKKLAPPLLVGVLMFCFLQMEAKFLFFYLEQQQLLLYDGRMVFELLTQVGGVSQLISYYFLQFYELPYCGSLITTLVLMTATHATYKLLSKLSTHLITWMTVWIPTLLLLFLLFNTDFFFQGIVAYLFATVSAWGYTLLPVKRWRFMVTLPAIVLLYLSIGSAALLTAMTITLWEILHRSKGWSFSFLYLPLLYAIGFLCVYSSEIGDFRLAYGYNFYYEVAVTPPLEVKMLLYMLPLLMLFVHLLSQCKSHIVRYLFLSVQLLGTGGMCTFAYSKYIMDEGMPTLELDHYVYKQDWPNVEQFYHKHQGNSLYLNCYNMALARQGRLGDKMFSVQQAGPSSLLMKEERSNSVTASLLSEVNLTMGNANEAQKMAYTSLITSKNTMNPHQLQRLVKTHIVHRDYKVAEKYLIVLSKSLSYADWATRYIPFVREEKHYSEDNELLALHLASFGTEKLLSTSSLKERLQSAIQIDSTNMQYVDYLGAFYLLDKDLVSFKEFIARHYRPDDEKPVPRHFQEALCAVLPDDYTFLKRYGVSTAVLKEHENFVKALDNHRDDPEVAQLMQEAFGRTFWYYLMFID